MQFLSSEIRKFPWFLIINFQTRNDMYQYTCVVRYEICATDLSDLLNSPDGFTNKHFKQNVSREIKSSWTLFCKLRTVFLDDELLLWK